MINNNIACKIENHIFIDNNKKRKQNFCRKEEVNFYKVTLEKSSIKSEKLLC